MQSQHLLHAVWLAILWCCGKNICLPLADWVSCLGFTCNTLCTALNLLVLYLKWSSWPSCAILYLRDLPELKAENVWMKFKALSLCPKRLKGVLRILQRTGLLRRSKFRRKRRKGFWWLKRRDPVIRTCPLFKMWEVLQREVLTGRVPLEGSVFTACVPHLSLAKKHQWLVRGMGSVDLSRNLRGFISCKGSPRTIKSNFFIVL
jgi:hypothetical protein